MRKFLLSLALGALSVFGASATVAGFGVGTSGESDSDYFAAIVNNTDGNVVDETFTAGDISIVLTKHNTSSKSNVNGTQLRWYANDVITVTAANGTKITGITIAAASASYANAVGFPTTGTVSGSTASWTAAEGKESVELTATAQVRFTHMLVEYTTGSGAPTVAAPTIELEETAAGYQVVMTAEDGAEIYYTDDESVPTEESTKYTAPIDVWFTTTYKAIAVKDGESSSVKTFEAVVPMMFEDFSGIYGVEPSEIPSAGFAIQINAPMTVVYQSADNCYLYLNNGSQNALFYAAKNKGKAVEVGSTLQTAKGTLKNFKGLIEITDYTLGELTPGTLTIKPTNMETLEGIRVNMQSHYLKLIDVTVSDVNDKNATITDAEGNTLDLYNQFAVQNYVNAENVDITGFVSVHNNKEQFYPTAIEEHVEPLAVPTFQYVYDNYSIRVKITAEEGATIYYTKDGSEPTTASSKYTAPVSVNTGATLKAIAVIGNRTSEVASIEAEYIADATEYGFTTVCNIADDDPVYYYFGLGNYGMGMYYAVAYHNDTYTYLYDEYFESYMLVEGDLDVEVGDRINDIFGRVVNTDGQPYMYDVTLTKAEGTSTLPAASFVSIADVQGSNINDYVVLDGVKLVKDGDSYKLVGADDAEVALVNKFGIEVPDLEEVAVTGFIGCVGEDRVIYPTVIDGPATPEPVEAPTFTYCPSNSYWTIRMALVEIKAEAGTTIFYTTDGSDPTLSSEKYTGPIEVEDFEGMTIKAIAMKNSVSISEVATFDALYLYNATYLEGTFADVYEEIDNDEYEDFADWEGYVWFDTEYVVVYQKGEDTYVYDPDCECYVLFTGDLGTLEPGTIVTNIGGMFMRTEGLVYVDKTWATFGEGEGELPEPYETGNIGFVVEYCDPSEYVTFKNLQIVADGDGFKLVDSKGAELPLVNRYDVEISALDDATITGFLGAANNEKAFFPIEIVNNGSVGISEIEAEGADAEYFNLQGVRVANPENGLYIRRQGGKAVKVLVK